MDGSAREEGCSEPRARKRRRNWAALGGDCVAPPGSFSRVWNFGSGKEEEQANKRDSFRL